jgi:PAS domain-containing protein
MSNFAGFWSYVHEDDRNSGGRILSLADRLTEAFDLLSVEPLTLFVDREIDWGSEWRKRIDKELQETTFFIPIITPHYFRSEACRKELLDFSRAARDFGVEQLILPIYYVPVQELERDHLTDEAMALVKSRQWVDLRDARLLDEADSEHRTVVNGLAERLLEIAEDIEGPSSSPLSGGEVVPKGYGPHPGPTIPSDSVDEVDDEGAGVLELLAKGEEALPLWTETVENLVGLLDQIGTLTQQEARDMNSRAAAGNESFASRLGAANRFAQVLDQPADELVSVGSDYVSHVLDVDPAVRTLIGLAEEDEEIRSESDLQSYFGGISEMVGASQVATAQLAELATVLEEPAKFSRELRKPARKMQGALRNIIDAQSIINEWGKRIDDLRTGPAENS